MNPELLLLIAQHNSVDLEAIVKKVGVGVLISLLPNILNILETVQKETANAKAVAERHP